MKALALVLCVALAVPAVAEPTAKDAPVVVKAGAVVPFDGVLDTADAFVATEKALASAKAKVASYEAAPPVPLVVVVAVVAVVVGGAAGVGVTYLATRPKP